ncbi:DoxX family protein [Streptomyces sporangiiformans]|uniref:Invasion protein n=1 Tax=Streptomyces sporangiiformans TaxID=2315329 RepID=A0A505DMV4_9ACTN|nr:DoxX family protein [Streptomyces sporangiiformans]TPQ22646.1 invasion protein [Streptomyces sporangiiformans]
MTLSVALACLVALLFVAFGVPKILAVAPMRELAAQSGFSVSAYRVIGVLEVAGAAGVALGLAVPLLGALAGAGLLLLMAGAVITHLRNGDRARGFAPAVVCALLVAGYLVALLTA